MFRAVFPVAAALLTFGIVPLSAAADDRAICADWQNEEAVAACSRLIRRNPNVASYYNNRGNACRTKHDYDCAIVDYDHAIRLDPNLANAYSGRGNVYVDKHDYDR